MLDRAGLEYHAVAIDGEVRVNIRIIQPDGVVTKINERGPTLSDAECDALLQAAHTRTQAGGWIAGCGSLPGGLPDDFYAQLVETGHRAGAQVVIDTSGPSLIAALAAGPDLIKPNADELADAVGGTISTPSATSSTRRPRIVEPRTRRTGEPRAEAHSCHRIRAVHGTARRQNVAPSEQATPCSPDTLGSRRRRERAQAALAQRRRPTPRTLLLHHRPPPTPVSTANVPLQRYSPTDPSTARA
jgi:1-phosphofructokinase